MRVKPQHLFFILIPLLASLQACKPDKPEPQKYLGTYPLGDIKDYLYFKPGSMWVYECDSTGELDTQVMVSCDTPWTVKPFIKYQLLTYSKKSLNEGSIYSSPFPNGDISYKDNYKYFYQSLLYIANSRFQTSSSDAVFFKPYDSTINGYWSSPTYYKGMLTNYNVLGKVYDTVRVFKVQATSGWPKLNSWRTNRLNHLASVQYYWARKVGLIQLKVFAWDRAIDEPFTHNWLLKNYSVK